MFRLPLDARVEAGYFLYSAVARSHELPSEEVLAEGPLVDSHSALRNSLIY